MDLHHRIGMQFKLMDPYTTSQTSLTKLSITVNKKGQQYSSKMLVGQILFFATDYPAEDPLLAKG